MARFEPKTLAQIDRYYWHKSNRFIQMETEDIETRPLWKPLHLQPVFEGAPFYGDGTSEALFERGLCLPSGSSLTKNDVLRVVEVILRKG